MAIIYSLRILLISIWFIVSRSFSSSIINPSKVKQVSWKPRAFVYEGFLTEEECDHMVSLAKSELKRSAVADNVSVLGVFSKRFPAISFGQYLFRSSVLNYFQLDPIVSSIEDKIATWTFLPKENGEDIQVLRFEHGQKYDPHFDYFIDPVNVAHGGHRIATVLMYLSDVENGGETFFPLAEKPSGRHKTLKKSDEDLSECAKKGIAVKPRKGDALLFFSLYPTAVPDSTSLHGGCPVLQGEKWSATKWIHVDSFDKIIDNGGSCKDQNANCERWAAFGECTKNKVYMVGTPELPGYCRRSCKLC